jgi:hypothetical protein
MNTTALRTTFFIGFAFIVSKAYENHLWMMKELKALMHD